MASWAAGVDGMQLRQGSLRREYNVPTRVWGPQVLGGVMRREDLIDIGITDVKDCTVLIDSLKDRSNDFDFDSNQEPKNTLIHLNLEDWLKKIKLEQYVQNFRENLMTEMDRIIDIWDEELVSILEIDRVGHRNRILLSVAGPKGMRPGPARRS